jgi:phage/plasmid primase-like uncharacterized protein
MYCGGKDRARWTDKVSEPGDGGYMCAQCGGGAGIDWMVRMRGEGFAEAIDTLGSWLNLQPTEVITKANKKASRTSLYKMGSQAEHEQCQAVIDRCKKDDYPNVMRYEGFYDGREFLIGEKDSKQTLVYPCHKVFNDGLDEEVCNLLFINEEGNEKFYARDYTRQSVCSVGSDIDDGPIYLCIGFMDSLHVSTCVGSRQVYCCFTSYNLEMVAYAIKNREVRIACWRQDDLALAVADDRGLKVVIPNDGFNFKTGLQKRLFNPADLT